MGLCCASHTCETRFKAAFGISSLQIGCRLEMAALSRAILPTAGDDQLNSTVRELGGSSAPAGRRLNTRVDGYWPRGTVWIVSEHCLLMRERSSRSYRMSASKQSRLANSSGQSNEHPNLQLLRIQSTLRSPLRTHLRLLVPLHDPRPSTLRT
jgi:hypothetical protein